MTINEAKIKIASEFITRYIEFLEDVNTFEDAYAFGMKYGYTLESVKKITGNGKDIQKTVIWFQKHIYCGRWLPEWEKIGYEKQLIWGLSHEGFLSYLQYSNWNARATGKTDFYFISQNKAKEIYKAYKNGLLN